MKVSINILNYNTFEKSKSCIESCLTQKDIEYSILLIDNQSTDNSFTRLKEEYGDRIDYYQTGSNYGYAKANNLGVAYCIEKGFRYSLMLNSDITLVGDELLRKMLEVISDNKDCAVVAPKIFNVTRTGQVLNQNDSSYLKLLRLFNILPNNYQISDSLLTISEAQGSALFVDNEEFLRVGGFPEHYFMYGEEGCFAKKIIWDTKQIIWMQDDDDYVLHHHDKSKNIDSWRLYLMGRNRYLEMVENKSRCPIKWSFLFFIFEIKIFFDEIRNKDLIWYRRGIKQAKLMSKKGLDAQAYIDDAIELINTHRE